MKITSTPTHVTFTPEFESEIKRLQYLYPGKADKAIPLIPSGQRIINALAKDFIHKFHYAGPLREACEEIQKPIDLLPLPDLTVHGFKFQPFPHQETALRSMITFNQHGVFLEMGLGKTFCSIFRIIHGIYNEGATKFLVICPKRVIPTWIREIDKFCGGTNEKGKRENPHFATIILDDRYSVEARANLIKAAPHFPTPTVYVTNYESFRHDNDVIKALEETQNFLWDICILDESVKIRYTNTKAQRGLMQIQKMFKKRYILSGLPAPQALSDYIGQFAFMHAVLFGYNSRNKFESDYAFRNSFTKKIDGWRDIRWIHERVHDFATVITKKDADVKLPDKIYVTRYCEMGSEQGRIYKDLALRFVSYVESLGPVQAGSVEAIHVLARLTRLSQISDGWLCGVPDEKKMSEMNWFETYGEDDEEKPPTLPPIQFDPNPKMDLLMETIEEFYPIVANEDKEIEKPAPFVVVARYTHEILEIKKRLEGEGYKVAVIRGGLTTAKQIEIQDNFDAGLYDGLIINISAGKYGLNLQLASTLIYFSCDYSWDSRGQSEERVYRIGQKNPVTIVDLVSEGTIDEEIIDRLKKKKSVSDLILKHPRLVLNEDYRVIGED